MAAAIPTDFLPGALNPANNSKRSRLSGAHQLFGEMPTATLADEILTPGQGQIRALLVIGGNPALSIPDQDKTRRALESLDLCVCIDGRESDTAAYADYFLPASYGLERIEMTNFNDTFWDRPFHQISQPVVDAPGDARAENLYISGLAERLNSPIIYPGGEIDPAEPPGDIELLELVYPEGTTKVSIGEIASHPAGKIFEEHGSREVIPALEGMDARLHFMPDGVAEEFALLANSPGGSPEHGYLLVCRRNGHVYNSMCHDFPQAPQYNPAWLHPDDIAAEGLESGQRIRITSATGQVEARLEEDSTMRRGVLSITHGFGGGDNTAVTRLLSTEGSTDLYTRIPQMSAVPVSISAS